MSFDPARFSLSEHVNCNWTATVQAGTALEDVLNPAFFANIANKLHPYDRIVVRVDTGEYYAELLVLDCARTWAKVFVLNKHALVKDETEMVEVDNQYEVKHLGPHNKWCVIRKLDKETIKEQCTSRQEANLWLSQHIMSL